MISGLLNRQHIANSVICDKINFRRQLIMKRVLLKLSGEALAGEKKTGFDEATVIEVAKQIKTIAEEGLQIGIVIGGGNFWRGRTSETIDRNKADQIGMLATVMNCIYVSDICRYLGLKTEIFTPFVCGAFTSLYSKDAVEESFAQGKIVFFAGGTGHPYFSTDTATVLRAVEIEAEAILLAKAVDGIYDSDPKTNPNAVKYDEISIEEVVAKKLAAMDLTASIMCMEQKMPMLVFALDEKDSIINAVHGKFVGTKVTV
jgi:uridylate kinase